jgi:hypothetical protein
MANLFVIGVVLKPVSENSICFRASSSKPLRIGEYSDERSNYLSDLTVGKKLKQAPNLLPVHVESLSVEMAMPPSEILVYDAPKVVGVADDDPDGHIPLELLLTGIEVVVPIWPKQSPDGRQDTLIVYMKRGGAVVFRCEQTYATPIAEREFVIPIGPEYLTADGVVEVSYQTRNYVHNPSNSQVRKLTIDHMPVVRDLKEVTYPQVSFDGYLNCETQPPIWKGIEIAVPPLPAFVRSGDACRVEWIGYLSLNGSGMPIDRTYKLINKSSLTETEINEGFSVVVEPFVPHIEPMIEKASAIATYSIYRGLKLIGTSEKGLVKIDRVVTGEELPCGP